MGAYEQLLVSSRHRRRAQPFAGVSIGSPAPTWNAVEYPNQKGSCTRVGAVLAVVWQSYRVFTVQLLTVIDCLRLVPCVLCRQLLYFYFILMCCTTSLTTKLWLQEQEEAVQQRTMATNWG